MIPAWGYGIVQPTGKYGFKDIQCEGTVLYSVLSDYFGTAVYEYGYSVCQIDKTDLSNSDPAGSRVSSVWNGPGKEQCAIYQDTGDSFIWIISSIE